MKQHIRWMVFVTWLAVVFLVLVPLTPLYVSSFLTVAGTVFLMRATSHYLRYGNEGLKFWRWRNQQEPRA
jgi:hypothetical protein